MSCTKTGSRLGLACGLKVPDFCSGGLWEQYLHLPMKPPSQVMSNTLFSNCGVTLGHSLGVC